MSLRRAKTPKEYADWVRQAMFEVQDLRECLMFEMEDLQRFPAYLELLEEGVKEIYEQMREGRYQFGREDLAFMDMARAHADDIPFMTLLKQINETHRFGLDVEESN